jgi:hypothetical protein
VALDHLLHIKISPPWPGPGHGGPPLKFNGGPPLKFNGGQKDYKFSKKKRLLKSSFLERLKKKVIFLYLSK